MRDVDVQDKSGYDYGKPVVELPRKGHQPVGELRHPKPRRALRRRTIGCMVGQLQLGLLGVAATIVALAALALWHKQSPPLAATTLTPSPAPTTPQSPSPTLSLNPSPTPAESTSHPPAKRKRVGLLAGHSGPQHDPGAICPDGLREADINLAVAEKVETALVHKGYAVDLLEEFDERLKDYRADAFLAIHTDSCDIAEASGFKVAHVSFSAIPEVEDALVECLYKEYARASGLPRHDFSITPNMHEYHAFLQIAPETPGAIIELGFMAADRSILVNQPDRLAAGIVAGLVCFLER